VAELDRRNLTAADWTVVGASFVALLSLFLPWFGVEYLGVGNALTGFSTGFGWIGALLIVAVGVLLLAMRSGAAIPNGVLLAGSVVGTALVSVRWATMGNVDVGGGTVLAYGPRTGIAVALLAGIVQCCGDGLLLRGARTTSAPAELGEAELTAEEHPPHP